MKRLEEIVTLLEGGEAPLEQAMQLFEEGAGLAAACEKKLRQAEQTIAKLSLEEAEGAEDENG